MDFNNNGLLAQERLATYHHEADADRDDPWILHRHPSAPGAQEIGAAVRRGIAAAVRCRWDRAEEELAHVRRLELKPCAQVALEAVIAESRGADGMERADLRGTMVPAHSDPHVWACGVIALALHESSNSRVVDPSLLIALCDRLCRRNGGLSTDVAGILCFSLALMAHSAASPVLAAFLLGHLAERSRARSGFDGLGLQRAAGTAAAASTTAATGLCMLTLGERGAGLGALTRLVDGREAAELPLVTGIVLGHLARVGLSEGPRDVGLAWAERALRVGERYGTTRPGRLVAALSHSRERGID